LLLNFYDPEADLEVRQTTALESNLLRKTKLTATFSLLHRCWTYLKSGSACSNL